MKIYVNEKQNEIEEGKTAYDVRDSYNKGHDIVILNGYPIKEDILLREDDRLTLIKRGEVPSLEEIESLLIARHTPNVHNKLKKGRVAILGLGGLGSNIAISLSRIGVYELILADYDVVEPSNLNRQQYFIEDIGMLKTEALKKHIKRINPMVRIISHNIIVTKENMYKFNEADIIIEAFDNPSCKAEICNHVLTKMEDKYLIASSGMAGYYDSNIIKTKKIRDKFYICGDFVNEAKIGEGLMAPRVAICANHMANLAAKILIENK